MSADLEQHFLGLVDLKPEKHEGAVDLTELFSLFPTYEDTNRLGRMEKEAVDSFSDGLRKLGVRDDVIQGYTGNADLVGYFATLAQMRIFQQEHSHSG